MHTRRQQRSAYIVAMVVPVLAFACATDPPRELECPPGTRLWTTDEVGGWSEYCALEGEDGAPVIHGLYLEVRSSGASIRGRFERGEREGEFVYRDRQGKMFRRVLYEGGEEVSRQELGGADIGPEPVVSHPGEDRSPAWSPDGRRLAFESVRDGNLDLYEIGADGSGLARLTSNEGDDGSPSWSPEGDRIVFQSERDGTAGLWILEREGGAVSLLLEDDSPEMTPHWSPDGRWIAFGSTRSGNLDLWAVEVTGGEAVRLTTDPARDVWPRWSPDGDSIVFFSRRDSGGERDELHFMDWSTRSIHRLTDHPGHHDFTPAWSPDGRRVVAAVSDSLEGRWLAIHDLEGRELHRLAGGFHRVFEPAWSPDGAWVAYAARPDEGAAADVFIEPTTVHDGDG